MSVSSPSWLTFDDNTVNIKENIIKGEIISVQKVYSDFDYVEMQSKYQMDLPNIIKEELLDILVDELMKRTCISFTMQQDVSTLKRCFRARIFATPDNQTRIVKELLSKNNMA